jgi:hypothetical protein
MDPIPEIGVMTRLIQGQCVQSLLRRGNAKSSLQYQTFEVKNGSGFGTLFIANWRFSGSDGPKTRHR